MPFCLDPWVAAVLPFAIQQLKIIVPSETLNFPARQVVVLDGRHPVAFPQCNNAQIYVLGKNILHADSTEQLPGKIVQEMKSLGYNVDAAAKLATKDANMDLLENAAKKTLAAKLWRSVKNSSKPAPKAKLCPHCGKEAGSRYCCTCASISLSLAAPALQLKSKVEKQKKADAPATALATGAGAKMPPGKAVAKTK